MKHSCFIHKHSSSVDSSHDHLLLAMPVVVPGSYPSSWAASLTTLLSSSCRTWSRSFRTRSRSCRRLVSSRSNLSSRWVIVFELPSFFVQVAELSVKKVVVIRYVRTGCKKTRNSLEELSFSLYYLLKAWFFWLNSRFKLPVCWIIHRYLSSALFPVWPSCYSEEDEFSAR